MGDTGVIRGPFRPLLTERYFSGALQAVTKRLHVHGGRVRYAQDAPRTGAPAAGEWCRV